MADNNESREWQRVETVFDAIWDLDPAAREDALGALNDAVLADRVRILLANADASASMFSAPIDRGSNRPAVIATTRLDGLQIGHWHLHELLGQGGMGEVYRAERADGQFRQPVALKVARIEALPKPEQFNNERQILATLEHPGIARLIDGGIADDGRPYMVMELVDGIDLLSYCNRQQLNLEARLDLFRQVCDAVSYAHRHLVIHRDLKPGNILVTPEGQVKLLDFGIAKLLEGGNISEGQPTQTLMTPDYAAPEQLEGRVATTATDVYALGVLLYQMLSGVPPWNLRELPLPAALQRLLNTDPKALSEAASANADAPLPARLLRGDLEAIVAKALRREPEARYVSAAGFWSDVQRHLSHQPVLARGSARSYLVRRFLRRYRVLVSATAAVFLALVAGLAGTLWEAHQALQQRNLYEAEDARSKAVVDYLAVLLSAGNKTAEGQPTTVKAMLERGAQNLDQQFAGRPVDYARIVEFLGDLYASIDDEESAVSLQQTFVDSPAAASAPASAAEIRLLLAQSRLRQGDRKAASAILTPAQAFWASQPAQFRGKLARSRIVEGQIDKANGDLEGAIAIYRRGLVEIAGAPGAVPEDTSNLQNSLGLALMQNGDYQEADELMQKVRAFRESEGRVTDNLLTAIQNQGAIALSRGDDARAESLLRESIEKRRQGFGPSGAMAAAEFNLAKALIHEKQYEPALTTLAEAKPMAIQFQGPQSPMVLGIGFSEAEAELGLGHVGQAAAMNDLALQLAAAKVGEHHPLYATGLILEARVRLSQKDLAEARRLADQAGKILDAAGASGRQQQAALQTLRVDIATAGS